MKRILSERRRRAFCAKESFTPSAVLMPLCEAGGELNILFTKRTNKVGAHKGQISFPGGVAEPEDDSLLATALRETEEEIGLKPEDVEILGSHDDVPTITGFVITPFVGVAPYPYDFKISEDEIEEIFFVPVSEMLDPAAVRVQHSSFIDGSPYEIYFFQCGEHLIWGATAKICAGFFKDVFDWSAPESDRKAPDGFRSAAGRE